MSMHSFPILSESPIFGKIEDLATEATRAIYKEKSQYAIVIETHIKVHNKDKIVSVASNRTPFLSKVISYIEVPLKHLRDLDLDKRDEEISNALRKIYGFHKSKYNGGKYSFKNKRISKPRQEI